MVSSMACFSEKKENSLITLNEEVAGLKGDIDRYKMQLEEETKKHAEQRKLLIESENKLLIQGQNHQNDKKQLPPAVVKDIESLRKKSADGEVLIDKLKSELRIQLDKRKLQNAKLTFPVSHCPYPIAISHFPLQK